MRSIGELARASGLTVSALRFYDRSGVLVPALVDPVTGYRWYADDQVLPARLVAGLRRVGMPLAEIAAAVRHRAEPAVVGRLLDAHLRRLEDGLTDARRELSRVRAMIDHEEHPMTTRLVLSRADLAAAIDAVRFAVGTDPELPVLSGVLFDVAADGVRLVATDRHRMAVARVPGAVDGPVRRLLAPVALVDAVRELLGGSTGDGRELLGGTGDGRGLLGGTGDGRALPGGTGDVGAVPGGTGDGVRELSGVDGGADAHLRLDGAGLTVTVAGREVGGAALPDEFPDYQRLLGTRVPAYRITVDVPALRAQVAGRPPARVLRHEGVDVPVTVLGLDDAGGLRVLDGAALADAAPDAVRLGVNGRYLLDALDAGDRGQLLLELDGPIAPLAVRRPDDADAYSILMPVRL
ncbi:DNA polymerase III subunit beta family protein [Micromonospora sp. PTRAS2]|uniref:DNA polymerase III subunit beta family protein n=1 Tax=unclassified Micromonospora TaxID=2617518 RepID=UPI001E4CD61A|nr:MULTISPECIES: MerR family transcriptional regulator [unclassified Micromonospora]MDI5942120.1 MerR family DNA-binding transcriptional regulator [Micromonospora sp. DH15]